MNTFIDIETIPQQPETESKAVIAESIKAPAKMTKAETIADWHSGAGKYAGAKDALIEKTYRDTSFDGSKGEIISIAWAQDDEDIQSVSRELGESEADMLEKFFATIRPLGSRRPPFFVGQYIAGFDLKFLFHRAVILGVNPMLDLPFSGRHGLQFYCTQQAWAGFGGRMSQDNLCKAFGIEGKPDDIDGSKVWDFVKAGKINEVEAYNRDDVHKNRIIYNRLNFITGEK